MPSQATKRKHTPDTEESPSEAAPVASPNKQARHQGPTLPPSTTNKDEIDLDDDSSDDGFGPSAPINTVSVGPSQPVSGPTLPPQSNKDEIDLDDSDSDTGPAPPAAAVGPTADDSDSSSDSDDDYGPALPGAGPRRGPIGPTLPSAANDSTAPTRDAWMLEPPTSSGYSERDTTKMRARKFTSKPGPSESGVSAIWTETPEEKLKRLQDSVLGRSSEQASGSTVSKKSKDEEERNRRIAKSIESQRGQSLYQEHQDKNKASGKATDEEDDPSKRAFDREKDMALGSKIGSSQRQELINKSANFGGRFQKGSYL